MAALCSMRTQCHSQTSPPPLRRPEAPAQAHLRRTLASANRQAPGLEAWSWELQGAVLELAAQPSSSASLPQASSQPSTPAAPAVAAVAGAAASADARRPGAACSLLAVRAKGLADTVAWASGGVQGAHRTGVASERRQRAARGAEAADGAGPRLKVSARHAGWGRSASVSAREGESSRR